MSDRQFEAAVAGTSEVHAEVNVATEVWAQWAWIALDQLKLAREGRVEYAAQMEAGEAPTAANKEMRPSMVAIAAVAFSLEGFKRLLEEQGAGALQQPPVGERNTGSWAVAVFDSTFDLGDAAKEWFAPVTRLFKYRNEELVHVTTIFEAPADDHPVHPRVSGARVRYSFESADAAVELMRDIYRVCGSAPVVAGEQVASRVGGLRPTMALIAA